MAGNAEGIFQISVWNTFNSALIHLRPAMPYRKQRNASWLMFSWVEENGRRAGAPPGPKGYGRELIEQALPYSHGAETRYELDETGLRCSIALPLGIDARQERRS